MPTIHIVDADHSAQQLNLVVGWASGLVQVWPSEDSEILPPEELHLRPHTRDVLATPDAVMDVLAAADGQDPSVYRRTYAAEAGAVLALTHHSEDEVLTAAVEIQGALRPSRVLAIVHRGMDADVHEELHPRQHLLAS